MGGHHFIFEVDDDCVVVGFDCHLLANQRGRNRVGVGVKANRKVGVDFDDLPVPAVGKDPGQGDHGLRPKSKDGFFSSGGVHPHIGYRVSPVIGLRLHIVQVLEGSQGPEIMAYIMDGSFFHFSLLVRRSDVTCMGNRLEGTQEGEESFIEADERTVPLDHCCKHVVDNQRSWGSLEENESIEEGSMQSFLSLGVRKFQVEHAAV